MLPFLEAWWRKREETEGKVRFQQVNFRSIFVHIKVGLSNRNQ